MNHSDQKQKPFQVRLTIGTPYLPPKAIPTLDALLWGAIGLASPECEDIAERIPLKKTDHIFHGSCMICDPLFPDRPIDFFQSINNERREDALISTWLDNRLYAGTDVDVRFIRNGDAGRGTFSTTTDRYTPFSRGQRWTVGFYGCGDLYRVESLLRRLPGMGRKASRGYGAIVEVDIEPVEKDYALIKDGKPMRPIPEKLWAKLGGAPLPLKMARAELHRDNPDNRETWCVAPGGARMSW